MRIDQKNPTFRLIVESVLSSFNITEDELLSKCRKRERVVARQLVTGISYEMLKTDKVFMSFLPLYLKQDHSTVLYHKNIFLGLLQNSSCAIFTYHYTNVKNKIDNHNRLFVQIEMSPYNAMSILSFCREFFNKKIEKDYSLTAITDAVQELEDQLQKNLSDENWREIDIENAINQMIGKSPQKQ